MRTKALGLLLLSATVAHGADHRDAPTATADPAADINDVYAFVNPTNPAEVIVALTVLPFANYNSRFSDAVDYQINIDNGVANTRISCRFTNQSNDVSCSGGGLSASGGIERTLQGTGIRLWAGLRDDPFYFDLNAFNATRAALAPRFTNPGSNFFSGNTLSIVLAIDRARLNNGGANNTWKIWAATQRLGDIGISPGFTGLWYDPARPGFGTHIEVLAPLVPGQPDRLVFAWYVYNTNGNQRWITGDGTINGSTATVSNAFYTFGGIFPTLNPATIQQRAFGTVSFRFTSCNSGVLSYSTVDPEFGFGPTATGEIPITRLSAIKDQPCTFFSGGQIDRNGRPAIVPALINVLPNTGTALKEAYNRNGDPSTWSAQFRTEMRNNLAALDTLDGTTGNAVLPPDPLSGVLVDDRLIIDTSRPACDAYLAVELGAAGCGGRTLARDVIDDSFGALIGPGVKDNVANDSTFLTEFPFLGRPL